MISPSQVHYIAQERQKDLERQAQRYRYVKVATSGNPQRLGELRVWIGRHMVSVGERLQRPSISAYGAECAQTPACASC